MMLCQDIIWSYGGYDDLLQLFYQFVRRAQQMYRVNAAWSLQPAPYDTNVSYILRGGKYLNRRKKERENEKTKNIDSTGDQNSRHISNHWLRCNNKNEILEIKFPGGVIQLKLPLERTICSMSNVYSLQSTL